MQLEQVIRQKMAGYADKLALFKELIAKEMQKGYNDRDTRLLDFLYKERAVYQFALDELETLIAN